MPPEKPYFPLSKEAFDREAEAFRDKMLPVLRQHHLHQLYGLNLALEIAFEEISEAANREDIKRGVRPPGTRINQ